MAWDGRRTLIGCAVGCGVLVVLVIALAIGFGLWLQAPGDLLEPEQLLGADTTGHVELHLRLDDPETAAFVERLIEGLQSIAPEDLAALPAPISGWVRSSRESKTRHDIERLFPAVAAWTLRAGVGPDGDELQIFSVSLERASHQLILADFVLGMAIGRDENSSKHRHLDETIYQVRAAKGATITAFIDNGIVFVTSDLETAKLAVDRLRAEGGQTRPVTALDRLFGELRADRPLRGAVTNATGEVRRLWTRLATDGGASTDDSIWDGVTGLTVSGELEPDGSLICVLELVLVDASRAADDRQAWERAFREAVPHGDVEIELTAESIGDRVRLSVRVSELLDSMVPEQLRRESPADAR